MTSIRKKFSIFLSSLRLFKSQTTTLSLLMPYLKMQTKFEISSNFHRIKPFIPGNQTLRVKHTLKLCFDELHILHFGDARPDACMITPLKTNLSAIWSFLIWGCFSSVVKTSLFAIYEQGISCWRFWYALISYRSLILLVKKTTLCIAIWHVETTRFSACCVRLEGAFEDFSNCLLIVVYS